MPNKVVHFVAKREAPSVFYFEVSEPSKIAVEVWDPAKPDETSHVDMRIAVNDD